MSRRVLCMVLLGSLVALSTAAIDPEEFECEEAVAHLKSCCGDSLPAIGCGGGCDNVDLTLTNAKCIRKASCDELVRAGACTDPMGVECQ